MKETLFLNCICKATLSLNCDCNHCNYWPHQFQANYHLGHGSARKRETKMAEQCLQNEVGHGIYLDQMIFQHIYKERKQQTSIKKSCAEEQWMDMRATHPFPDLDEYQFGAEMEKVDIEDYID